MIRIVLEDGHQAVATIEARPHQLLSGPTGQFMQEKLNEINAFLEAQRNQAPSVEASAEVPVPESSPPAGPVPAASAPQGASEGTSGAAEGSGAAPVVEKTDVLETNKNPDSAPEGTKVEAPAETGGSPEGASETTDAADAAASSSGSEGSDSSGAGDSGGGGDA